MKTKLKTLFSSIIAGFLLLPVLIIPNSALADGIIVMPDPYSNRWDYLDERNQQAFINYENGLEKMILTIGTAEISKKAAWIFPVPAEPKKLSIDVVTTLPQLKGVEIAGKAKSNLPYIQLALYASQIYPLFFKSLFVEEIYAPSTGREPIPPLGTGPTKGTEWDVQVYEHLDKEGIATEIITTKTAAGLYQYLQEKNLKIEKGTIPVLDSYIGKEFTFVVSWISETAPRTTKDTSSKPSSKNLFTPFFPQEESAETVPQKGVFVTFPTKKIYYPLLPTSVYGSKTVPTTIRVMGFVSPEVLKEIKNYTKTQYFIDERVDREKELKNFYGGDGVAKNVKYTKIEINAPSKMLTDDLWISSRTPFKTYYYSFIAQHIEIFGILLFILSSMITSVVVGWVVFRDLRNKKGVLKLLLVGLSNCLSLLGLMIATALFGTKAKDENVTPLLNEIRQKGYVWKRKLAVVLLLIDLLLLIYATLGVITIGFKDPISIAVCGAPLLILAFILFIQRIKEEDKPLFTQLKAAGYSSWSLNPKDKMKLIFVPLFSFSFLAISWLIIKLVELIL